MSNHDQKIQEEFWVININQTEHWPQIAYQFRSNPIIASMTPSDIKNILTIIIFDYTVYLSFIIFLQSMNETTYHKIHDNPPSAN